ncbi:MAG: hypothetical protein KA998_05570 [Rickettsiaceae bacterium]|nr:hypothetical protein [Rickettsiaceae bacterium]
MPVMYSEDDFKPAKKPELQTLGSMLRAIDINPDNYVMYDYTSETPVAFSNIDTSLNYTNFLSNLSPDATKPYKVAGVFLVGEGHGTHYVGAVFEKKPGENGKLTLIDSLGNAGGASFYSRALDNIGQNFEEKFGSIDIYKNPSGKVLYQNEDVSCAFTCKYTVEHLLREKEIEENVNLGIYRSGNGELRCEAGAKKLRERELRILNFYREQETEVDDLRLDESEKKGIISGMMMSYFEQEDLEHSSRKVDPEEVANKALSLMSVGTEGANHLLGKILDSPHLSDTEKAFMVEQVSKMDPESRISIEDLSKILENGGGLVCSQQKSPPPLCRSRNGDMGKE